MANHRFLAAMLAFGLGLSAMNPALASMSRYDFFQALRDGDSASVDRALSEPGSKLANARDGSSGETPLLIVTQKRDLVWMNYLLGKGADPDMAEEDNGDAPLHIAAQLAFLDGAKLLVGHDADVDIRNRSGETPLIRAVRFRHPEMVKYLIRVGADPDLSDSATGRSARDYAEEDPRGRYIVEAIRAGELQRQDEKEPAEAAGKDERPANPFDFSGDFLPLE